MDKLIPLMKETPDNWSYIATYIHCQVRRALVLKEGSTTTSQTAAEKCEEKDAGSDVRTPLEGGDPMAAVEGRVGGLSLVDDRSEEREHREPSGCGGRCGGDGGCAAGSGEAKCPHCSRGGGGRGEGLGGSKDSGLDEETLQSRSEAW